MGISAVSAKLYENKKRDDLVIFYFRKGAQYASVYTQSNIKSENIKWNLENSKEKNLWSLGKHKKCKCFYWKRRIQVN